MTESTTRSGFAPLALGLWLVSILAFFGVAAFHVPKYKPVFESTEVDLPGSVVLAMDLGGWMQSSLGWVVVLVVLLLGMIAYRRGPRDNKVAKRYLWAAVAMFLVTGLMYAAVEIPVQKLRAKLMDGPENSAPR